jgi:hypothetical protein
MLVLPLLMLSAAGAVQNICTRRRIGEGHTEWLIVELDQCATDMLTAVAKSKVAGRKRLGLWERLRLDC